VPIPCANKRANSGPLSNRWEECISLSRRSQSECANWRPLAGIGLAKSVGEASQGIYDRPHAGPGPAPPVDGPGRPGARSADTRPRPGPGSDPAQPEPPPPVPAPGPGRAPRGARGLRNFMTGPDPAWHRSPGATPRPAAGPAPAARFCAHPKRSQKP